jgi:hypothetical protein
MLDADQFRRRAQECVTLAESAKDPGFKRHYKDLAQAWLNLARHAETLRRPMRNGGEDK